MQLDHDHCYRAVQSRDARFDGWFVTCVRTTGIYCRPSCPAITPKAGNVEFASTAAAAQGRGFRACRRCRPDASPGSPEWQGRSDAAARAMRLIADGEVDRTGVAGVAARIGYSARQLQRLLVAEVGAGPLALARAQRAQTARVLLETTDLRAADVAFAAGFSSVRQFNDTIREVFADTPTGLRGARVTGDAQLVPLRLAVRRPFAGGPLFDFLGRRAAPGVESYDGSTLTRVLSLPSGPAIASVSWADDHVSAQVSLTALGDLAPAAARLRRWLDLDADPVAVDAALTADPILSRLVAATRGLRSPGAIDGFEIVVRAVLGQQVSVAGARTLLGRVVAAAGRPLPSPVGGSTHEMPDAAALAETDLSGQGLTGARQHTLRAVATAVASGAISLDPGADRAATRSSLLAVKGIGPWTADYVALRAFGDPDAFCPTDLGVRHAADRLGLDLARAADSWRPWRAYAQHHLWRSLSTSKEST